MPPNYLIVFDMDGTLYDFNGEKNSYDGSTLQKALTQNALSYGMQLTGLDQSAMQAELIKLKASKTNWSAHFVASYGVTKEEYFSAVWNVQPVDHIPNPVEIAPTLNLLVRENVHLVLITRAPKIWQERVFQHLQIDPNIFHGIYTTESFSSKGEVMQKLVADTQYRQYWAVGDEYKTDIEPGVELGFIPVHVSSAQDTIHSINQLLPQIY